MYEEWDVERGERKYDDEKLVQSQGQSGVNPEGPQSFVIITFNMIILFILWGRTWIFLYIPKIHSEYASIYSHDFQIMIFTKVVTNAQISLLAPLTFSFHHKEQYRRQMRTPTIHFAVSYQL